MAAPLHTDFNESDSLANPAVAPSFSNAPRRQILHTYRRRRFRNPPADANCHFSHQCMSSKRSSDSEHHTCVQTGFHDLENPAIAKDPNNSQLRQSRHSLFEDFLKTLKENGGGVGGCMKAAFEHHGKQSCIEKECAIDANCPSSEGFVLSATQKKIDANILGQSDGLLIADSCTNTEMCQCAFSHILASGEFASLCKLLSENFQGVKVEGLFDCSFIDRRIKEGAYEHMPVLFSSDIHQFWKRLERVGTEIISFSRSLSNRSKACCIQNGVLRQDTPGYGKQQGVNHSKFSSERFDSHDDAHHLDALAEVAEKSDGKGFFICQLCQAIYHFPCIEPALKEISSRNGFCGKCIANGAGLTHGNCAVCKKLQSLRVLTNGDSEKLTVANEEVSTDHDESSNSDTEAQVCKVCSFEIGSKERYQVCGHEFCQGRFYHERCLTVQQLKSHASCWYCPSCMCRVCFINKDDDKIVLCDGCDHGYHIHCLSPPLGLIPRGKWYCSTCKAGMMEIGRVRKAYMSGFTIRRKDDEACKEADGQLRKKQNTTDTNLSNKEEGMDILLAAANVLNKK